MTPPRIVGLLLVVVGVVLLVLGFRAIDSFGSQFHEFFTGSPSDRGIWLLIGGVVAIVAGAGAAVIPFRASAS